MSFELLPLFVNRLRFIPNCRTMINNDFRKNLSPKGSRTTRKGGKTELIFQNVFNKRAYQ
jgi:hypothetical protein